MKKLLATSILSAVLAFPAFAQMSTDEMSCADFTAMDSSSQMEAMSSMASDAMASDAMASDDMGVMAESVAAVCADNPDMMVNDAAKQAMN